LVGLVIETAHKEKNNARNSWEKIFIGIKSDTRTNKSLQQAKTNTDKIIL
jgi:hypothetical protein